MRQCRLIKTIQETDPRTKEVISREIVVYKGTQKTHMQRMLDYLLAQGSDARIECDAPHKRKPRINSLTHLPATSHKKAKS